MTDELKSLFCKTMRQIPDYYEGFDICTWSFIDDEEIANLLMEYVNQYSEATTVDVINYQEWLEDQRNSTK